ncbi:DUF1003 domain-containing protein [Tannockella kyphosi]|uniref:DUF1003 domain-containing protein n=1 Tax=Tannockella kyphosi TaxID=2899121 RepID=UPI002012429B|nr:DUF1003 domain-containing protein [Tannockella kyphosi]
MQKLTQSQLLKHILQDTSKDMQDEDIIHLLLEQSFASKQQPKQTFLTKLSDRLAAFGGSWSFLFLFFTLLVIWICFNVMIQDPFDPYPFILLNLCLSCISSFQAPIIMMAQNRQAQKDKILINNQYKIHLKNEIILQDIHEKLDKIIEIIETK